MSTKTEKQVGPAVTAGDRELAGKLGVQARAVAQVRAELCGDGLVTDEVRGEIARKLGLEAGELGTGNAERGSGGTESGAAEKFELLLILHLLPNKTFVRVRTPEGKPYALRVRSSVRLRPGMKLQCVRDGDGWKCVHAGFRAVQ